MKWINFNTKVSQAKCELIKKCRENGFEPDGLDLAENLDIGFHDDKNLNLTYSTNNYETCMIVNIQPDRLVFVETEFFIHVK